MTRQPPDRIIPHAEPATATFGQLMLADRPPYETAANGRRYVRRHQLDVITDVRETRAFEPG